MGPNASGKFARQSAGLWIAIRFLQNFRRSLCAGTLLIPPSRVWFQVFFDGGFYDIMGELMTAARSFSVSRYFAGIIYNRTK
jgi:hypothetical protein